MAKHRIIGLQDDLNNPTLFTPWSLIHMLCGSVFMANFNYFNINKVNSILILLIFHTLYEVKDYYYSHIYEDEHNIFTKWFTNNSSFNSIGDTIAFIVGIFMAINSNYSKGELIFITILYLILSYLYYIIEYLG
jgi:hypothetical protein